jgi:hypothetical protein
MLIDPHMNFTLSFTFCVPAAVTLTHNLHKIQVLTEQNLATLCEVLISSFCIIGRLKKTEK